MDPTARPPLPPRWLPILYFGFAHACLGAAFLTLSLASGTVVGFFYHPRMIALVHLVTLGWITGSILGGIYLVAPIGLRMRLPAGRLDYMAFAFFAIGTMGMVGHFWIDAYSGMLWSAGTLLLGIAWVTARVLGALPTAVLPLPVKAHIGLAFLNILGAGVIGFLVGLEQLQVDVLPGFVLDSVYAHAHLAAVGWATMAVVGIGYRLFPMFLPAAMPRGHWLWASVVLLEAGALGLAAGHLAASRWTFVWGLSATAGLGVFGRQLYWMRRHRKRAPAEMPRPDYGMGHAFAALGFLVLATIAGLGLVMREPEAGEIQLAIAYGVFGLLGFLAQMVVGMQYRLLPMFSWMQAYAGSGYTKLPPSPHRMARRGLQLGGLALWLAGVPALALSLYSANAFWVAASAWGMLLAVALGIGNNVAVILHAFGKGYRQT